MVGYTDANADYDLSILFRKRDHAGALVTIAELTTGSGASSVSVAETIDNENYSYFVEVSLLSVPSCHPNCPTNRRVTIRHVQLAYTMP